MGFACVHGYPEGEACPACGELPVISERSHPADAYEHDAGCDGEWPCSCVGPLVDE